MYNLWRFVVSTRSKWRLIAVV